MNWLYLKEKVAEFRAFGVYGEFVPLYSCLHTLREWYRLQNCDIGDIRPPAPSIPLSLIILTLFLALY